MNEWKSARFWFKIAIVVLGAVGATWPEKPIARLCAAITAGLGAIGLGVTPALAARAARAKKE